MIDERGLFWFEQLSCGNEDCKRSRIRVAGMLRRCLELLRAIKAGKDVTPRKWGVY